MKLSSSLSSIEHNSDETDDFTEEFSGISMSSWLITSIFS